MSKLRKLVEVPFSLRHLWQLRKDQWKDLKELKKIQFKMLKRLLKHAYDYVPYYHKLFSTVKIKPDDIRNLEDFRKIPTTSKQDVQKNFTDIITRGVDISKLPVSFTSGSTGIPLKIIRSYTELQKWASLEKYILFERGVKLSDNYVIVWGRGSKSIQPVVKNYAKLLGEINKTIVPLFPPEKLVKVLQLIKPDVLDTFPSVLLTLANYDASEIHPRMIFTGGEIVTEQCRSVAKKVFGVEPLEAYASVEFDNIAFECNERCGLHTVTNSILVEFISETGEYVSPGEEGEIIITGLWNHVMPLIRYRIGDLGIPSDEKCPCGRSWPIIKSIQGRNNDFLVLRDGKKISWFYLLRHILYAGGLNENLFCLSQYQLVQERYDRIVFKFVKGTRFDPNLLLKIKNKLENEFAKQGEKIEVVLESVDEIPSTRTGKRQLFISKVN